ncbi:MAG: winged helix-turn-helix domain-containing protein [Ktedonobacteraceae bacterium]|nr:winged helix-turn-helix domain-containing protein [Ktedonobacteraceae bacterium]
MQQEQTAAPRWPETSVAHVQPDRPTTTYIRIYTFGLLRIEWVDQHSGYAAAIPPEKLAIKDGMAALWLLKLLLSQPHRYALRDEIMEYFWPEASSTAAAKRLDNVVYALRKLLRPPASPQVLQLIQGHTNNGSGYQLAAYPHIWVDADAFAWYVEQAARMERFGDESLSLWETASHLAARGTYLADERYSEWAMQRRAILEGQYRQCVHRLAALYRQQGNTTLAELRLRTYWQTHPTDEDALRPLLELLGEQERYQEAQTYYQHLLAVLQEEGRDPDGRTQDIAEYLRTKQITRQRAQVGRGALEQAGIIEKASSLPIASYVSAEGGVLLPAHLVLDTSPLGMELPDGPTWCAEQITDFQAMIASWQGQGVSCLHLQVLLHTEIERWNITQQPDGNTGEMFPTRRTVLAALVTLPPTLLSKVHVGPLTTLLLEEFLALSAASLTACWHLFNGEGLATVEYALPKYLPLLVALARQPSKYQSTAAYLSAQGSLLMDLVSFHRLRFREALAYARQAVELAHVSGERNLHVYALLFLAGDLQHAGKPKAMLQTNQEAVRYLNEEVVPLLHSYAFACLADAYAQNGQVQDAFSCIGKARDLFPSEFGEVPYFVSTDYGHCQLILFEGMTYLGLGEHDAGHVREHNQTATNALAQVAQLPSTIIVPERYKVQIINEQAKAAIGTGNREEFEHYLLAGVAGAKALGSEKRRQEAVANWRAARKAWPHEQKILKLADALMEL